ncbi:MAG TPA: ABC transporter ATP-binding protein [Anaerolineaceae bacterium]
MPEITKRPTVFRLFGFLKPWQAVYFASLVALAAVYTSERLFIAYVVKLFIDAIMNKDLPGLWHSVQIWFIFLVFYIPASALFSYLWRSVTLRVITSLRQRVFSHLQRLPLASFEKRHSGDLLSLLTNDITTTEKAFDREMFNLVNASMQGISAAVYMMVLNWQLALIIILTGMLPLGINFAFAKPLRKVGEAVQARLGVVSERLADLLAGYQVVRTFHLGEWILERFGRANQDLKESGLRQVRIESALAAANEFGGATILIAMGIGGLMILNGQATFGILIALIQLNGPVSYLVYTLGGTVTRIQASLASADRLLAALDEAQEPERYPAPVQESTVLPEPGAMIDLHDVHFAYDDGKPVLNGLSLSVRQGQVAAIVGPSGGGKSTLFKLLLGTHPPQKGALFVNGKPLYIYRLADLRRLFAYIPQDTYLYTGSILENIRYGQTEATLEQVRAAARAAYADEFISEFPAKYDTLVGERGARLSGGQRQRIAIARALLKDAPVLLLDEATSALDSESEELVQRALGVLMRGRTVLVIAHRLSTIENADVIYVVDGGKVVESGTHAELMAKQGLFYRLHELQFKDEESEGV